MMFWKGWRDIYGRCDDCRFYHHGEGECRRYAPRPTWEAKAQEFSDYLLSKVNNDDHYADPFWPSMPEYGWCGEFSRLPTLLGDKPHDH